MTTADRRERIQGALDDFRRVDAAARDERRRRITSARDQARRPAAPTARRRFDAKATARLLARCDGLSLAEAKDAARKLEAAAVGKPVKVGPYEFTRKADGGTAVHRDRSVAQIRVLTVPGVDVADVFGIKRR